MNTCKITLAVPYYNNLFFLEQTLKSITRQTQPGFKVIISDDCSAEPAQKIAASVLQGIDFTYYRNEKNLGMVGNWNQCVKKTETQYLTLLHADDLLHENYVKFMSNALFNNAQVAAIFCGTKVIDANNREVFSLPDYVKKFLIPSNRQEVHLSSESGVTALLRGNFIMCPTMCYNTEILKKNLFDPHWKQVQDLDLFIRLLLADYPLMGLPDKLYYYRRHANNATENQTRTNLRFMEEFALYRKVAQECDARHWNKASQTARKATIVRLNLLYNLLRDVPKGQFKAIKPRLAMLFSDISKEIP